MGSLPTLKPRDVARLLDCLGFVPIRQRGSHRQHAHPDGRRTTLPFHSGRDLSPVLLRLIARDVGLAPGGSLYEAVVMRVVEDSGSRDRDTLRILRA